VIWTNFGPHHIARIRALSERFQVEAIELASFERLYGWQNERELPGINVHTIRQGACEDHNPYFVALKLWRRLSILRPEILLVPGWATPAALSAAAWGTLHKATTIAMSDSNANDYPRGRVSERIKHSLVTILFDCGIVAGKRAAAYLQQLGIPPTRIGIGYDVVDNDFFAATGNIHAAPTIPNRPYFLFVGRLSPEKNLPALLRAFDAYRASGPDWSLVIAGDGPLSSQLREQAARQPSAPDIIFVGHKTAPELRSVYAHAACLVLPSLRDSWGLVVNEAMASGLPVLVSNRCGCSDDLVKNGENGYTFDPASHQELLDNMLRISKLSNAERASLGLKSREIIGFYSPQLWANEIQRLSASTFPHKTT
jgi:glycosyltransferase involved in cell wall biosynthesis